ncbi:MAG TPA: hypothetical protein VFB04_13525 [Terriglobales bacterium]|nr:hypothetical protein [Terriglobales bacterium]
MLTTGAATAIALVTLVVSSVIGVSIGFGACLVFRLPWNLKVAAIDAVLVVAVSIASAYVYSAIAMARGQLDSGVKWILLTAAVSVVLRHLVRFALRIHATPVTGRLHR